MSSTTPAGTPSKESRGFGWGSVGKAVRRATLLGSTRDSRPSTPTPDSGAASAAASTTNLASSNPNIASSASASTANLAESTTTIPKASKKDGAGDDSDRASIKSKKSERSLTDRFLLRRSSTSSVKGSSKKGKQSTLDLGKTPLDTSGAKPVNPVVAGHMVPSPIAESPNREAMETPPSFGFASSPLASENVVAAAQQESPTSDSPPEPIEGVETESNPASPQYTHPPLLDSSAGNPGAFVDDSDTLPQPTIAVDPYAVGPYGRAASRVSLAAAAREEREERVEDLPNPHEHEGSLPNPHEGASTAPTPAGVVGATRGLEAESSVGGPSLGGISSEADYGVQIDRAARDGEDEGSVGGYGGVYADSPSSHGGRSFSAPGGVEDRKPEGEGYGYGTNTNTNTNAATAKATEAREREPEQEREPTLPAYQLEAVGNGNGHDVWRNDREDPFVTSQYPSQAQTYSQTQPYTIPRPPSPLPPTPPPGEEEYVPSPSQEDHHASWGSVHPVASSREPASVPHISVTKSVGGGERGIAMPQPQRPTTQVMPVQTHRDDHPTILMPLPPFNDVVAAQPLVRPPEPYSTRAPLAGNDNDERRPLLGGSATKPLTAPYGIRPAESTDTGNPSPASAWAPTASSSTKAAGVYSLPRRYGSTTSFRNYDSRGQSTGRGGVVGAIPGLGVGEGYGQNAPKLHELGWFEYHLPDGSFYYVHPTLRVTTDVNLRNEKVLDEVTQWIDEHPPFGNVGGHPGYGATTDGSMIGTGTGRPQAQAGNGVEVWLRDTQSFEGGSSGGLGGKSRRRKRDADEVKYIRCWVDHQARTVVLEKPNGTGLDKKGKGRLSRRGKDIKAEDDDEDQLDMEYRYWSFMEAHPAHTVLPVRSRNEALEVLTWAYTDRLLPAQKPVPPPFGPSECDELRNLIKSFPADSPDDNGIQTRIVSRVLLRVASWRQAHFRPNKPLPKDVKAVPPTSSGIAGSAIGRSVLRLVWDMFVVLVCLGLPYIFVERKRRDEEAWRGDDTRAGGGGTSVFAISVISCLVSAIILSASVTFLSLPGMTGAARIAGFVAISCAVGSMLASTIAFIKFRNEFSGAVGRASGAVSGEGLVGISNKAIVSSLPLVFVAYSIIGFVVGLSIYSFHGSDLEGTAPSTPGSPDLGAWFFSQGAKWSALGLLGAAGGVVAMSWVVWKQ